MAATVHHDTKRRKYFLRVYDQGRQWKSDLGTDREEARSPPSS